MNSNLLDDLYPAESILFLGSGFSRDALNIRNEKLPLGDELKQEFARLLNVDHNLYDLQTLADEANSNDRIDLYQILYELFTVKQLTPRQENILKLNWRRIYTTNYDDAIELYYNKSGISKEKFCYFDRKPNKLKSGSIVHLHGMIHRATHENVLQQIILNESAYVRQHFEKSIWYEEFTRDLRFSHACYFVGYSLKDYHISSILLQDPSVTNKTFFITSKSRDQIFANRISAYGQLLPIGIERFAEICKTFVSKPASMDIHALKSFRLLDPFKDKKPLAGPTSNEILHLVTYGTFNYQRCLSTLPDSEYVVARQNLAVRASEAISRARCLLVHSLLGNGKSIFLHILAHQLSSKGFECVMAKTSPALLPEDLRLLKTRKNLVVFFDSYDSAIDLVPELIEQISNLKFVIAVRTGIQEVRFHEIVERFPKPLERINLNNFSNEDKEDFKMILDRSGVRTRDLDKKITKCRDFREIVTTLYDHSGIRTKVREELDPLLSDDNFRRVFVATHLLKWAGYDVDAGFLRNVTDCDAYAEIARFRDVARDIFRMDDDDVQVRSSVFSEYLIQNLLDTDDVVDNVHSILIEAVKRKGERQYQAILGSLMRFSLLSKALEKDSGKDKSLIRLYEKLRRDPNLNEEPLFWLQYSILMTAVRDFDVAEELISTAYDRADKIPTFRTFQIDTYALRLLLLREGQETESNKIQRFDQIVEKIEHVKAMIREESRRDQAIKVLAEIEPFVFSRRRAFSESEKNSFILHLNLVDDELAQLNEVGRMRTGSDKIRKSIEKAKQFLLI